MAKTDKKQPWLKFYPSDWSGDRKLHMCSIGARGLWVEMMCVMHEAEPYGHLVTDGKPVTNRQIASLAGVPLAECGRYMMELESAGVYSRTDGGTIYSRRMVRDKAKAEQDRNNGKGGGNPQITNPVNEGVNPPDKAQKPSSKYQSSEAAAEARALDENGLKQERVLIDLFTGLCSSLGRKTPDLKPIATWLLDGIALGTISEVCQPLVKRKADMVSLSYCDAAVREKHRGAQSVPSLSPVPMNDSDWDSVVKRWKSNQSLWPRGVGGEPGMLGCRCPANILNDNLIHPVTGRALSEPLVFVHEQTDEMAAWCHDAQIKHSKPPVIFVIEVGGVEKRGAYMPQLVPDGYDSMGERIQPASEVA